MKKNDYQNLMEHIQPPAGLNDRVLSAARQTAGAQKETTGPKHLAPGKRRPVLRAAVCAACALALVVGSVTLGPRRRRARRERRAGNSPAQLLLRPDGLCR